MLSICTIRWKHRQNNHSFVSSMWSLKRPLTVTIVCKLSLTLTLVWSGANIIVVVCIIRKITAVTVAFSNFKPLLYLCLHVHDVMSKHPNIQSTSKLEDEFFNYFLTYPCFFSHLHFTLTSALLTNHHRTFNLKTLNESWLPIHAASLIDYLLAFS